MDITIEHAETIPSEDEVEPSEKPQVKKNFVRAGIKRFINTRVGRIFAGTVIGAGTLAGTSGANHHPSVADSVESSKVPPAASTMVDRPSTAELLPYLSPEERFFVDTLSAYLDPKVMDKVMAALDSVKNSAKHFSTSLGVIDSADEKNPVIKDGYFLRLSEDGDDVYGNYHVIAIELSDQKRQGIRVNQFIRVHLAAPVPDLPNLGVSELDSYAKLKSVANWVVANPFKFNNWGKIKGAPAVDREVDMGNKMVTFSLSPNSGRVFPGDATMTIEAEYRH